MTKNKIIQIIKLKTSTQKVLVFLFNYVCGLWFVVFFSNFLMIVLSNYFRDFCLCKRSWDFIVEPKQQTPNNKQFLYHTIKFCEGFSLY